MPNGVSTPSATPPPCSTACCVIGTAPATWQQAQWPSRLLDSLSHRDDDARPHRMSLWLPRASTTPIDVPTYLGMSPRLRRAGWAATKAARSHGMSPAVAPDPMARHQPSDAPNTSNDVFMPSGTSPGAPNAELTTSQTGQNSWDATQQQHHAPRPHVLSGCATTCLVTQTHRLDLQ